MIEHELLVKAIKERRSVRRYKTDAVAMEKLQMLVEAARWAPSAGNSQPWRFLLITDKGMLNKIKMVCPGWLKEAPALVIMCIDCKRDTDWSYFDVGAAMQNVLLYAHSLGLGCCPIGSFVVPALIDLLELPDHLEPVLLITVGYPDEELLPPPRLSLDELIFKRIGK
ncbi:MAG: nitroreductase family protein [Nitrososphaeria archaeon]|nr:nitroreductase family protein [Nitrososphaeria archaeon]